MVDNPLSALCTYGTRPDPHNGTPTFGMSLSFSFLSLSLLLIFASFLSSFWRRQDHFLDTALMEHAAVDVY